MAFNAGIELLTALNDGWRDPDTGFVNLHPDRPAGKDSDNGILFTATMLICLGRSAPLEEYERFAKALDRCQIADGIYARYPGERESTSWDDYFGAALAMGGSPSAAHRAYTLQILDAAEVRDFEFGDKGLWRMPLFEPALRVAAGRYLNPISQVRIAGCYLQNCFEKKGEVSGTCMLYLLSRKLDVISGPGATLGDWLWRVKMGIRYPGGPREVYGHYFKPQEGRPHPFATFGPDEWTCQYPHNIPPAHEIY